MPEDPQAAPGGNDRVRRKAPRPPSWMKSDPQPAPPATPPPAGPTREQPAEKAQAPSRPPALASVAEAAPEAPGGAAPPPESRPAPAGGPQAVQPPGPEPALLPESPPAPEGAPAPRAPEADEAPAPQPAPPPESPPAPEGAPAPRAPEADEAPAPQPAPPPEPLSGAQESPPLAELEGPAGAAEGEVVLAGPPEDGGQDLLLGAPEAPPADEAAPAAPPSAQAGLSSARLVAELDELASILQGVEPLKYLEPRLANWKNTGVDASSLLSIYRLVSRGLKDEIERLRGLMQRARAEMEKMAATIRQLRLEPAAPPPPPAEETLAALREQLEARGKELLAAEERYEKLMNDVRNMRARMESDVTRRVEKAREDLVKRLLPVLDSFEWGLRQVRDATDPKAVLAGMESIFKQLREALRQEGLTEIPTEQQIFDPRVHEGMGHVPTHEVPEDWIYDELRKGYFLGDRLLRAAMVRLARRPGPGEEPQPAPWAAAPLEPEPPWPDGPQGRPSSEPADEGGEVPQGQDYDRDLLPGEEGPELGPGDKEPEEVEEREESPPLE